jgi:osmotically-inducible protein OsmY
MKTLSLITLSLFLSYQLSGCTAAVVGGAVAGSSVALDKRTTGDYVEDQNIKVKYSSLYYEDKELSENTHVNWTSYNRQMLLTGEAPNEELKQRLGELAGKIKNVRYTFNEITIGPITSMASRSNDTLITSKIKTQVFSHLKELDNAQVKVVTENGAVFLMGLVNREQGDKITEIARTTRGVKRVIKLFEYPNPNDQRI